jgi:hypothetical protein
MSDTNTSYIHPSLYDVVMKQYPSPEFRLFPEFPLYITIWSDGEIIGLAAHIKL